MIVIGYMLVCLVFGTTFLAIKVGMDAAAPPFFSAGMRFFIAGLILFLWSVWRGKASFKLLMHKEMLINGALLTFGTFSTLYWAEQYVASGVAAILSATGPLMILLLQVIVMKQRSSRRAVLGCLIGFTGVILLVLPSASIVASMLAIIGCIAILVGELAYSSGALYAQNVIQRHRDSSPIALNAVQMIYGGLLLFVLSGLTEHVHVDVVFTREAVGSLLYLTIVGSMVGHSLFYWLVAKTNPVFPSTWLYVSPPIALLVGVLFYQEPFTWVMGLGVVTIITGTVIVNWESLRQLDRRGKKRREISLLADRLSNS
ncbi:drug/metabolite transporter (DMT)-like permease [Paenibacillus taihuensis]|uniref:Drug/metabolite transporter (DMT)-like permease n=1 Tax=Paenibacillus taihuensis TaxID=1156355 RepID=A0A3D9S331_9BACL|nr:EamA family transporter [Paenibacillus taihuensis]REE86425.1 drug/metabolite transporter (DMT)-like permease [Paenibacillus taihuensis]